MRILVTGARGFTGQYMCAELREQGHEPVPLMSNLLDAEALQNEINAQQFDAAIHLAAISTVTHEKGDSYYAVNLIGSRNLLMALAQQPTLQSVLLASSGQVYGRRQDLSSPLTLDHGFCETDWISPINEYSVSKFAMEQMASLWLDRLPLIATRPFNYTGLGQSTDFIIPKIVQHFRDRAPVMEIGNISLWREFGDVRDVVRCYRRLIEDASFILRDRLQIVNVCTGAPQRLSDVIDLCVELTGHSIILKENPAFLREGEPEILIGNPNHLTRLLPEHSPRPLRETIDWMLSGETT